MKISGGRFLLTGGASLIGSHVAEQLLEAGAGEVVLFDNYALGSPEVAAFLAQDKRVRVVRGDITRLHELLDALDGIDGVFALAGFLTLPLSQNPGLGLDVNVHGIYIALRYSTVYGERQHHRGVNALHIIESYERIKAGERPVIAGDGSEAHDYVYVGDVARANVMAMTSKVSGESFLIATGVDSSVNDIVAILLKLTGSPLKPRHRDEPGKVLTTTKAALGFSPAKAKRLLGWEAAVGVEDGIRRLIAWAEGSNRP